MCNDCGNHIPYSDYLAAFSQNRIRVKWPAAAPNLEPRDDIWPPDPGPVIRHLEDGTNEFAVLRRGFPPASLKERQLSISDPRGALPGGSLSGSRIAFFRVHRDEVA